MLWRAARLVLGLFFVAVSIAQSNADTAQYFYDAGGRLTGVLDPVNGTAQYFYDKSGNINSIVRNPLTTITVLQVSPNPVAIGSVVTVAGTAFGTVANTSVSFNGTSATPSAVTSTSITVTVPGGATSGTVSVTSPAGTASAQTPLTIGLPSAPTIASFTTGTSTPTVAHVGDSLTISGTHFDTVNSKVFVNNQFAQISSATSTSIVIVVPQASSGKVKVETPAGTVVSTGDLVIAPTAIATNMTTSVRTTIGASAVSVSQGASGTASLVMFDAQQGQKVTPYADETAIGAGCVTFDILMPNGVDYLGTTNTCQSYYYAPFSVVQSGTYSISLVPVSTAAGTAQAQIYNVPPDPTATATIGGPTQSIVLTAPGQQGSFTFSGTSGQKVSLNLDLHAMDSGSNCYNYTLSAPDGTVVFGPTHACFNYLYVNSPFTLSQTGTYKISIVPDLTIGGATAGVGTIYTTLFAVPADAAGPMTVGGPQTNLSVTTPGQNASFTFSGTSGNNYTINLDSSGMTAPCYNFSVINPDTTALISSTFECTSSHSTGSIPVSQTGTFTVYVVPYLGNGGLTDGTGTMGTSVTSP